MFAESLKCSTKAKTFNDLVKYFKLSAYSLFILGDYIVIKIEFQFRQEGQ